MKKIIKTKQFWYLVIMPLAITSAFFFLLSFYGIHQDFLQLKQDAKENEYFDEGYEKGRFDQLNDSATEEGCLSSISKNPEVNILLQKYFGDCEDAKEMWAIAQAESSGAQLIMHKNTNGTLDCGWLQVNSVHKNKNESQIQFCQRMGNLEENVKLAKEVKDKEGWGAWVQYKNGNYLKYLK